MARNITVYDLDNYPDNSKTVTVDQSSVVPTGYAGDEQWVLSFKTSAYSDNTNSTAIQDIYVQKMKTGWYKTSGLVSLGASITISGGANTLGLNIDNSSKWYYIQIASDTYGPDALAEAMQDAIQDIPDSGAWSTSDDSLSYLNAQVEYDNGKFKIISGTVGEYYTGSNRTSVSTTYSGTDTMYYDLGFDLGIGSYDIATTSVKESLVTATCNDSSTGITINSMSGLAEGDVLAITDKTHTEYVIAKAGTTATSIVIEAGDISNTYTANRAKVQKLQIQDPDQEPVMYHSEVDSVMRWGINSIVNQIDFSS
jgi:hypothetical protein